MKGGRKGELAICLLVAAASLAIAAACHRFAPGVGVAFKPLLWPLSVLPFAVRMRCALTTAFAVPLISCAVTGMPTLPVAMALSACAMVFMSAFMVFVRMVGGALRAPRNRTGNI